MRRTWFALVLAVATALVTTAVAAALTPIHVTPGSGSPAARFRLGFTSPYDTGQLGTLVRRDVLSASGPPGRGDCVASISVALPAALRGHRVRVTLNPKRFGGVWCVGRFSGRIDETVSVICLPRRACPEFVVLPRTIATFSFRVTSMSPRWSSSFPTVTA